uniref:Uncharacterized protein n=1 Tax=Rhizophora mucronata TaxID=61149 RepID=A0A2P2PPB2_RHIMU
MHMRRSAFLLLALGFGYFIFPNLR